MSDIGIGSPRLPASPPPSIVKLSPPDIAQRRSASWSAIQADTIQVTRREPFEYKFQAWRHLLIAYERAARDDGETVIEGLPKSTLREFSRTLSVVPREPVYGSTRLPATTTSPAVSMAMGVRGAAGTSRRSGGWKSPPAGR